MAEAWEQIGEMGAAALVGRKGLDKSEMASVNNGVAEWTRGGDGVTVQLMVDGWTKAGAPRYGQLAKTNQTFFKILEI